MKELHLFKITDVETFWVAAHDCADAVNIIYSEYLEGASKVALSAVPIADDTCLTIRDGADKETRSAALWASIGRGVIAATCD